MKIKVTKEVKYGKIYLKFVSWTNYSTNKASDTIKYLRQIIQGDSK